MEKRRTWVKLWCYQRLHSDFAGKFTEAEQSVWDKLLALCGLCEREGIISDTKGKPHTLTFISWEIHSDLKLLKTVLNKCVEEKMVTIEEDGIHITNWSHYQSDYHRQKPYRQERRQQSHAISADDTIPVMDDDMARMVKGYEDAFGIPPTHAISDQLQEWRTEYTTDSIIEAMSTAVLSGHRSMKYAGGILRNEKENPGGRHTKNSYSGNSNSGAGSPEYEIVTSPPPKK
ncbi:MAG: DnaD domain protein [Dehalococcoidia bacterium]|jgi:DnaD/phage-associated family protein